LSGLCLESLLHHPRHLGVSSHLLTHLSGLCHLLGRGGHLCFPHHLSLLSIRQAELPLSETVYIFP
jgi:hypothetical protein